MEPLNAHAVARLLTEIGQRMELAGELSFKARAYYNAADSLQALPAPLLEYVARGKLRTIPGVGEAIAEKIIKLHLTGTHPTLEHLREQMPAGVLEMLRIPGLGPKKTAQLYQSLNIASLKELEEACKRGRIKDCKGLGTRMEAKILQGIEMLRQSSGQSLIDVADERLGAACELLAKENPKLQRIVPAGSVRRGCELTGDYCIVAQDGVQTTEHPSFQPDLQICVSDKNHYGTTLLFATGSGAHLDELCALAASQGLALSEKGLFRGGTELLCPDEQDVYTALGLPYIEPELREGRGELALARKNALPVLVADKDIRGILHSHTTYSDGSQPLAEMAEAVRKRGYQYYGVADHSQTAAYAGGLTEDKVREQQALADGLNAKYTTTDFHIFKGIESDIREDGSLDYPENVLRSFDFIVASVHSRFTLDKHTQTARIVKAVSNPRTTVLGHMTGRLLLRREGYAVDIEEVLNACARHGVAVEINANPQRLDLDWRWHQRALELGCLMSINPDAHSIGEIDLVKWGVRAARKGGVPPQRVLSAMTLKEIAAHFEKRKLRE